MPLKKLIIYYFTGTGNSRKVSEWIQQVAVRRGIETECLNLSVTDRLHIRQPDLDALLLFVSPVHGFNYPPVMMHFLMRFPKGKNQVALANTRAGMLIGKFITPGLTGIAFYFAAFLLKCKGYSIRAMFPVDLPSNWISIHPGLNQRTIRYLHSRNKERVTAFAERILSGKTDFRALREIIQDTLIAPVSILYYFIGRFFFAKTYYASANCDNCGLCIKNCPVKAIRMVNNRPFWTYDCESCMRCMSNCPKKAIETGHGYVALVTYLSLGVGWLLIVKHIPLPQQLTDNYFFALFIKTALFFLFLTLVYRLVHFLLRYRFFSRIIEYTSLTKFSFWGRRYKALRDKDFEEIS